jgi:tRNA (cmo5U34)-methyltransferase
VKSDNLFSKPLQQVADFSFDAQVAQVFPDMINRSIPGYAIMIQNIGEIANRFASNHSVIYDLGCATGISTLSIARAVTAQHCRVIGIDNSSAMLEQCNRFVKAYQHSTPIELIEADILNFQLAPCSVVVMNFTLQFLPPDSRETILQRIHEALLPGGVLILSEKVKGERTDHDELLIHLHHNFKRDNGYSDLEISQKRTALENVMLLDTQSQHFARFDAAGFDSYTEWYRCFNFSSMLAFKA